MFTLEAIQFETGKSLLRSSYQGGCERLASWMLAHPEVRVRVEGHTDNVGSTSSNQTLSLERAEAVRVFLEAKGVDASRVDVLGLGDTMPVADNTTERGRSRTVAWWSLTSEGRWFSRVGPGQAQCEVLGGGL